MTVQKTTTLIDETIDEELKIYINKIDNQILKNPNISSIWSNPFEFRANLVFPITESNKTTAVWAELTWYDDCNYEIWGDPEPIYSTPEYYDEMYYEEKFSNFRIYRQYWSKIEEYYGNSWMKIKLKYNYNDRKIESEDESWNIVTRWPYNYIQIEKMDSSPTVKSNLLFLDTEVHDLRSPEKQSTQNVEINPDKQFIFKTFGFLLLLFVVIILVSVLF